MNKSQKVQISRECFNELILFIEILSHLGETTFKNEKDFNTSLFIVKSEIEDKAKKLKARELYSEYITTTDDNDKIQKFKEYRNYLYEK